jgi:hypothetical protein
MEVKLEDRLPEGGTSPAFFVNDLGALWLAF